MFSNFAVLEYYLAAALLVSSMIGMGTTLTVRDFLDVAKSPRAVGLVLVLQWLVMPLAALGLARLFQVTPGIAVGMLLVVALPGGAYTNLFTYLGRGNVALSVAATTVCTAACVVTTPFVLKTFGQGRLPDDFVVPTARIFTEIGVFLLLPLAVGMVIRRVAPRHEGVIGRVCIRISLGLLVAIVVGAIGSGRFNLMSQNWRAAVAVGLLGFVAMWVTYLAAFAARLSALDAFTIAIEVVVRNANLGLLLKASLFPADAGGESEIADAVLYCVLLYGFLSLVIAAMEVVACRKGLGLVHGRRGAMGESASKH